VRLPLRPLLACCLALAGGCARQSPPPPPAAAAPPRPTFECRFTEDPITIDGKVDDAAWQRAVVVDSFTIPWEKGAPKARRGTRARLLWDRENLYVAADMDDTDLFAHVTEHDGNTWENDVFEVFLKPSADKPAYYEFHVNAANAVFDLFLPRRGHVGRFKRDGEFHIESAVALRGTLDTWTDKDEGWSVEMRIPWESLVRTGGRPEAGDEWRLALCRYDFDVEQEAPELSSVAPLSRRDFHRHEDYAAVRFVGPQATAQRPYGIPKIVPVSTSKVAGSPEPPLPFTIERTLPLAKVSCPITVAHQPGSDRLIYSSEGWSYSPSQVLRIRDDAATFEPEVLIPADDATVHYAITFHPRFAENGHVFIGSNGLKSPDGRVPEDGKKRTRITRYVIDREPPYAFHRDSATVIIEWPSDGHNGGDMAFGADGTMYVGSGDGTSDSDADRVGQDLTTLRAKILRIDPDHPDEDVPHDGRHYSVPKDNPIFDADSPIATVPGARPETWAYGLRQPWRIVSEPEAGRLWVGNQGQDLWEQIYLIERGANYGWSVVEGTHKFNESQPAGPTPFSKPVAEHPHADARAMTGGLVYRGSALPELRGAYLYADYSTGRIWGIRHDGSRVTWHELIADTPLQITAFGTDSKGEILICDHQPGDKGGFYRLVPAPPAAADAPPFPRKLSESGLFADVAAHRMVEGVIPYEPASPLWSDGTHKARFFALPPARDAAGATVPAKIGVTDARGWNFPNGTVLVKSFAIDEVEGDPATRRWIETRFMLKEQGEWVGYSYEWNDEQTDAELVAAGGKDREFTIRTAGLATDATGVKTQQWHYPSRTECMVCHSRASNYVLGLCTVQLNRDYDYQAVLGAGHAVDNQLRTLEHLGLLEVNWWGDAVGRLLGRAAAAGVEKDDRWPWVGQRTATRDPDSWKFSKHVSPMLSRAPERTNRLVNPYDDSHSLEARARSYLHSNCSSCHVFAGGGNALIELEYLTAYKTRPLADMKAIGVKPLHATFDLPDARLIAAGHPERSVLHARMSRRGPGQMPQLATAIVDERAVALVRDWILSLPPEETKVSSR
jgi:glucose/arabinose dehydrogenase/mono/diheme cytochrome c family protein